VPSNKEREKVLSQTFDLSILEESVGGKNNHVYIYEEYWKDTFELEKKEIEKLQFLKKNEEIVVDEIKKE
jgi:uncharacterized damage-inducible protein DinB